MNSVVLSLRCATCEETCEVADGTVEEGVASLCWKEEGGKIVEGGGEKEGSCDDCLNKEEDMVYGKKESHKVVLIALGFVVLTTGATVPLVNYWLFNNARKNNISPNHRSFCMTQYF